MTTFSNFIQGSLLGHGVVSGVLLLTRQGEAVYSYGVMQNILQTEMKQFLDLFEATGASLTATGYQKDFSVTFTTGSCVIYKAYKTSYSSIYATCTSDSGGLVVCNLPYGVLVCVYPCSQRTGHAIKCIENFCDLMRR